MTPLTLTEKRLAFRDQIERDGGSMSQIIRRAEVYGDECAAEDCPYEREALSDLCSIHQQQKNDYAEAGGRMSETPKHNPLPWHVSGSDNNWWVAPEGWDERVEREHYLGGAVCQMDNWNGTDHWHDAERSEANARLIVQAVNSLPIFLEAEQALGECEGAIAAFTHSDSEENWKRVTEAAEQAKTVLSRLRAAREDGK